MGGYAGGAPAGGGKGGGFAAGPSGGPSALPSGGFIYPDGAYFGVPASAPAPTVPTTSGDGFGRALQGMTKGLSSLARASVAQQAAQRQADFIRNEAARTAALLEYQALQYDQNANAVLDFAQAQRAKEARKQRARLASRKVQFLKGGIQLSGTPLLVLEQIAAEGELAAAEIFYEGAVKANELQNNAMKTRFRSQTQRQSAEERASNIEAKASDQFGLAAISGFRSILGGLG